MDKSQRAAYELGWDFAMYGRPVPEDAPRLFCDGYRSFSHGGKKSNRRADVFVRKWLQIRFGALRRGKYFDPSITPCYLANLLPKNYLCPVTRTVLTAGELSDRDWSIDRANNREGYVPGNLIILSRRANKAKGNLSYEQIKCRADGEAEDDALTLEEWRRLAEIVRPMHRAGGSRRRLDRFNGQMVAPGTPLSVIASFQTSMVMLANAELFRTNARCGVIFELVRAQSLKLTKKQRRAYRSLYLAIRRRVRKYGNDPAIWDAPRVQKTMTAFLNSLKPQNPERALEPFCRRIEQMSGGFEEPFRQTISKFIGNDDVGEYSKIFVQMPMSKR